MNLETTSTATLTMGSLHSSDKRRSAIALLLPRVTVRHGREILNSLESNPHMVEFIHEVLDRIGEYFNSSDVVLDAFSESEDNDPDFFRLLIRVASEIPDALEQLDRFDEEWWDDQLERADGRLIVDVEFV